MTRIDCRRQAHAAERLASLVEAGATWTANLRDYLLAPVLAAYLSTECEIATAVRIHAALDRIG